MVILQHVAVNSQNCWCPCVMDIWHIHSQQPFINNVLTHIIQIRCNHVYSKKVDSQAGGVPFLALRDTVYITALPPRPESHRKKWAAIPQHSYNFHGGRGTYIKEQRPKYVKLDVGETGKVSACSFSAFGEETGIQTQEQGIEGCISWLLRERSQRWRWKADHTTFGQQEILRKSIDCLDPSGIDIAEYSRIIDQILMFPQKVPWKMNKHTTSPRRVKIFQNRKRQRQTM